MREVVLLCARELVYRLSQMVLSCHKCRNTFIWGRRTVEVNSKAGS